MSDPIQVYDDQASRLIELEGQLDEALSPQLEALLSQPASIKSRKIVINLEKVPVITAEGVRVLLNAYLHKNENNSLTLKNPNIEVRQLLTTVGLDNLILN